MAPRQLTAAAAHGHAQPTLSRTIWRRRRPLAPLPASKLSAGVDSSSASKAPHSLKRRRAKPLLKRATPPPNRDARVGGKTVRREAGVAGAHPARRAGPVAAERSERQPRTLLRAFSMRNGPPPRGDHDRLRETPESVTAIRPAAYPAWCASRTKCREGQLGVAWATNFGGAWQVPIGVVPTHEAAPRRSRRRRRQRSGHHQPGGAPRPIPPPSTPGSTTLRPRHRPPPTVTGPQRSGVVKPAGVRHPPHVPERPSRPQPKPEGRGEDARIAKARPKGAGQETGAHRGVERGAPPEARIKARKVVDTQRYRRPFATPSRAFGGVHREVPRMRDRLATGG